MTKPSPKFSGLGSWNKARKQKKKEKEELLRQSETPMLKMITFIVTLVAMALGMSFLPLFPQPLPILLAVLVAFATYKKPRFGMPVGGAILGLGLLYHLADLFFISFLGETPARVVFIVVWMTLFIVTPFFFNRYKSALAIDFGILAVVTLFVGPIYFLAIPLILASAVYFKKYVGLTVVYYALLTVPLQIMQYYQYTILPIVRDDWWVEAGTAPPVFVSLSSIAPDLALSMDRFRLYDASNFIYNIVGQVTWIPDWSGRTIKDALTQYLDSIPGILMFVLMVAGLALALVFFTRLLMKEGIITSADRFFPCFTATVAAGIFFVLLSALQEPLAYYAEVGMWTMVLGIIATAVLTAPVIFMDFTPKRQYTNQQITDKAQALLDKIVALEGQIGKVKENVPVVVSSPEGKAAVVKDSVQDILKRASLKEFEVQRDLDEKWGELDKLGKEEEDAEAELNTILSEFQILCSCEFANWVGKLGAAGLNVKTELNVQYQKDMPLEQRIDAIKQSLEAGKALAKEVSAVTEPIYGIIRSLYDPSLAKNCYAVQYAADKIAKKETPWIALEALYNALNNWAKHYGTDVQETMRYLQSSLKPIAYLGSQKELLPSVFGENTTKVLDYAKVAEAMKAAAEKRIEKDRLDMQDIMSLNDDVYTFIAMANDVLSMLLKGLVTDEETIERLLPTKDYTWEKNASLRDRLSQATDMLSNPSSYKINEVMEQLPKYLGYIGEAVQTLAGYAERKEFLYNYPLAEAAIAEKLKVKETLVPSDLPFRPQFAAEYLRLYYSQRFGEYMFDKENFVLAKRT